MNRLLLTFSASLLFSLGAAAQKKVLFFIAQDECYYSEYIVAKAGLEAAGYTVDVYGPGYRSTIPYMIPNGTTIEATANTLAGSSYGAFQQQFQNLFGATWNAAFNSIPAQIPTLGSILEVTNANAYDAFVLPGGIGAKDFLLDGVYFTHDQDTNRTLSADTVELVANHLNTLGQQFLAAGKPVLAQCHGAILPVYWRIAGTSGPGTESLGFSLIKGEGAAGFPDAQTATLYQNIDVVHRSNSVVVASKLHSSFPQNEKANFRLLTSRDWYPQTVAHAIKSLVNLLETYPKPSQFSQSLKVLVLHGGMIDSTNCHHSNLANDIPCNHAGVDPADYRHVVQLLTGQSDEDFFQFEVSDLNMSQSTLPYDSSNAASFASYLSDYDVVFFYKHWATHVRNEMMQGLKTYVEDGGGLVSIHHGLYSRDEAGGATKQVLVNEIFGAASLNAGFGINLGSYELYSSNHGHFVSTFGMDYPDAGTPNTWSGNASSAMNLSHAQLPRFGINDELYTNMNYTGDFAFGYETGEITPLFSSSNLAEPMSHTSGFVRVVNANSDEKIGRVAYFQPGERRENYDINSYYGQILRNAVYWTATKTEVSNPNGIVSNSLTSSLYPNPSNGNFRLDVINSSEVLIEVYDLQGRTVYSQKFNQSSIQLNLSHLNHGVYMLRATTENGQSAQHRLIKK